MQTHKDTTQEMKQRHLANTIELQYQQLKALHEIRTEHLNNQHATEWDYQLSYTRKKERELNKKHIIEQKEHPKSLRVSLLLDNFPRGSHFRGLYMYNYMVNTYFW